MAGKHRRRVRAEYSHPVHHPEAFPVTKTLKQYVDNGTAISFKGCLKDNWKKNPDAMLRARNSTAGIRAVLPGVIMGIYAEEEIERVEVTTSEQSTQSKLLDHLKAKIAPPAPEPVIDVESAPVPRPATSEWGTYVFGAVEQFNTEIGRLKDEHPGNDLLKPVNPRHIANHIVKTLATAEVIKEEDYKTAGKQDNKKVGAIINAQWSADQEGIVDMVNSFLLELMGEMMPQAQDESDVEGIE